MNPLLHVLATILAGWLTEQQQMAIDYLREENRVLRAQLGNKRILLNDDQRRHLAVRGKALGRNVLMDLCTIVTPDTIVRWHRRLIASKYDGSRGRRLGRPRVMERIRELCVMMATEDPSWGYSRIQGALSNLGHRVSRSTIRRILKDQGLEPAPQRHTPWSVFLRAHWEAIAAADFFTVEACGGWVTRVSRGMLDAIDGFLLPHRYLIHDRDPMFTAQFTASLHSVGIEPVRLPPRSPNLNAYAERFVRSIKEERLCQLTPIGERHLRLAIEEYAEHYHPERNHQGLGNRLIDGEPEPAPVDRVQCDQRLGGLLRSYRRAA